MHTLMTLPTLSDPLAWFILGVFAVAVFAYCHSVYEDIKKEFLEALEEEKERRKKPNFLAEWYHAAAFGDIRDAEYWEETSKNFR